MQNLLLLSNYVQHKKAFVEYRETNHTLYLVFIK